VYITSLLAEVCSANRGQLEVSGPYNQSNMKPLIVFLSLQVLDRHMYTGTAMLHTKKGGTKQRLSISSRIVRVPSAQILHY
jgi:hypothetical protein